MTDAPKNPQEAKIKKGLPARRDAICYQTQHDITIPAGTILRQAADQRGGNGVVEAVVGFGKDFTGHLVVQVHPDATASGAFKQVIAS